MCGTKTVGMSKLKKNGVTKSTSWPGYEPRLCVDISDSQKIEETLEKYITNFKNQ